MAKHKLKIWLLGLIAPMTPILIVLCVAVVGVAFASSSSLGSTISTASTPSQLAIQLIPSDMLALYQSDRVKSQCPTLSWTIVASMIHQESNDNRFTGGPDGNGTSPPAYGASQFQAKIWDINGRLVVDVGKPYGEIPDHQGYGVDGDGDSLADIMNPLDSVPATARAICDNGGGNPATLPQAIYNYNHAWWYVYGGIDANGNLFKGIIPFANELAGAGQTESTNPPIQAGPNGLVNVAAGANLRGRPITPETMIFLQTVAGIYGKQLVCTTGTNHSYLTVDGYVSDHSSGHACDFGMVGNGGSDDGPVGDAIATACLLAAGVSPQLAVQEAQAGGLYTISNVSSAYGSLRVQCIWKTYEGGNHHNHVHIGARPEQLG